MFRAYHFLIIVNNLCGLINRFILPESSLNLFAELVKIQVYIEAPLVSLLPWMFPAMAFLTISVLKLFRWGLVNLKLKLLISHYLSCYECFGLNQSNLLGERCYFALDNSTNLIKAELCLELILSWSMVEHSTLRI